MKTALYVAGALATLLLLAVLIVVLVGRRLPERHTATREAEIAAPIDQVAERVRDVERHPSWRRGVRRISVAARDEGVLRYTEHGADGDIPYAFREVTPSRVFTSTIDSASLPFGGEWTITLAAVAAGTRVTIREDGVVRSALFRFVSAYVLGHTRTIDAYLQDLARAVAAAQGEGGAPSSRAR